MRTRAITVGADGTDSSRAAVDWAAREAERRHLPLRIMHVFDWEWRAARYDIGSEYLTIARSLGEAVSAAAFDQARAVAPDIEIEAECRHPLADGAEPRPSGRAAGAVAGQVSGRADRDRPDS
jgi:nucleotide-binding universal stress UspA family protein